MNSVDATKIFNLRPKAVEAFTLRARSATDALSASIASTTKANGVDPKELRKRLGQFVGSAFYGTMFRQMEQSKLKTKYLSGGRGEEIFRGQLYSQFAERMGEAPNNALTNRLYKSVARRYVGKMSMDNQSSKNETTSVEIKA